MIRLPRNYLVTELIVFGKEIRSFLFYILVRLRSSYLSLIETYQLYRVAEQLWNIGNRLMAVSVCPSTSEARRFASDVFAASHDFCITSEEEEGASLSKGYTDYDAKYNTEKMMIPIFAGSHERTPCDISSEFSGQCLLLSAATAVDYASGFSSSSRGCTDDETKALLRSVLHRLAQAQEEFQLNCEDAVQKRDVDKMIALLTLRCLLGVGNDSLAQDILLANGLGEALNKIHNDELHQDDALNNAKYTTLLNVYLMSGLAEETQMNHTSSCLLHMCAKQLPKTGKFVLLLGDSMLSLGDIQRKLITSASSTKDIIAVYKEIDELVKKHRDTCRENSDDNELDDATFYSEDELTWFIIEAYNRGVHQSLLCDWLNAEVLFATALNLLPFGGKEVQCHAKDMRESYQNCISKKLQVSETLSSILATAS